jgi:hypothetical protein
MNERPPPYKLTVDKKDLFAGVRRAFSRAVYAMAMSKVAGRTDYPDDILRRHWKDDGEAERMLRAVSSPTDSASFWSATPSRIFPALAPASATSKLMQLGHTLSLDGVHAIKIPMIPASGRPQTATSMWVAEGDPGPVYSMLTSSQTLGPVKKTLFFTMLSEEIEQASAGAATQIIEEALEISTTLELDAALFSSAAPTAAGPAGLLYGVTPLTPSSTAGAILKDKITVDLAALDAAMSAAGINPENVVYVCSGGDARKIKAQIPQFEEQVFVSTTVPAGTIIACEPSGFWTAYGATAVTVEASRQTLLHTEDTTPAPIVGTGGQVAVPTRSLYQTGAIGLKVRGRACWQIWPGAVAWMQNVNW